MNEFNLGFNFNLKGKSPIKKLELDKSFQKFKHFNLNSNLRPIWLKIPADKSELVKLKFTKSNNQRKPQHLNISELIRVDIPTKRKLMKADSISMNYDDWVLLHNENVRGSTKKALSSTEMLGSFYRWKSMWESF